MSANTAVLKVEEHRSYTPETVTRADVAATLQQHGYQLDSYLLHDKFSDEGEVRTITIKATRNLVFSQPGLPLGDDDESDDPRDQ